MQKVMLTLPEDLLKELDTVAKREKKNRSKFVREVLTEKLHKLEKKELDTLMAEGYQAMAGEDLQDVKAYLSATKHIKE